MSGAKHRRNNRIERELKAMKDLDVKAKAYWERWERMTPSERALDAMRSIAYSRRGCRDKGWPTGDGMQIDSGPDYKPPEWTVSFEEAWHQLTAEERELLAGWRLRYA